MLTYYCPPCWAEFRENIQVCPHCGYDIRDFDSLDFEDKLLAAARHPVPEYRYLAIQALGRLRAPRALPVIAEILQEEHPDIYLAYCAVAAAANIPGPGSLAILEKAARHPYRLQGTA